MPHRRLTPISVLRPKPKIDRHAPRHRFKNPFTMSKTRAEPADRTLDHSGPDFVFSSWRSLHPCSVRSLRGEPGGASRDRTDDLKLAKLALSQLSYGPVRRGRLLRLRHPRASMPEMVGRGGLEPPTLRLSGVRSNHLSYRPPSVPAGPNPLQERRPRAA